MNRKPARPTSRHGPRSRQRGLALLSAMLGIGIASGLTLAIFKAVELQRQTSAGRTLGTQMEQMRVALQSYMAMNYNQIIALPKECTHSPFSTGAPAPLLAACGIAIPAQQNAPAITIANGARPTLENLHTLGLLGANFSGELTLPTDGTPILELGLGVAPSRLATLIRYRCVASNGAPQTGTNWCPGMGVALEGLVFNTQPYRQGRSGDAIRLGSALQGLEGRGAFSTEPGPELLGLNGQGNIATPIIDAAGNGSRGILAAAAWVGSGGSIGASDGGMNLDDYTRRDGTHPPTATWDFAEQVLGNVKTLVVNATYEDPKYDASGVKVSDAKIDIGNRTLVPFTLATSPSNCNPPSTTWCKPPNNNAPTALYVNGSIQTPVGGSIATTNIVAMGNLVVGSNKAVNNVNKEFDGETQQPVVDAPGGTSIFKNAVRVLDGIHMGRYGTIDFHDASANPGAGKIYGDVAIEPDWGVNLKSTTADGGTGSLSAKGNIRSDENITAGKDVTALGKIRTRVITNRGNGDLFIQGNTRLAGYLDLSSTAVPNIDGTWDNSNPDSGLLLKQLGMTSNNTPCDPTKENITLITEGRNSDEPKLAICYARKWRTVNY